METLKLTVQEATEQLLMSQSSIYSWMEKGKLQFEDAPTGKLIVITKSQLEQIRELNLKSKRNRVSKQQTYDYDNQSQNDNIIDAEYSTGNAESSAGFNLNYLKEITDTIKDLAIKAGKVELLEDQRLENKSEVEMWRNKFYEEQTNSKILQNELEKKNLEIDALKKQIDELKSKKSGFLGIFGKK